MPEPLDSLLRKVKNKRLLIMGIGNRLRGDDSIGPLLIDRLEGQVTAQLLDAGDVPENYLGVVESAHPEIILVVDAVQFGGKPGEVALFILDQLANTSVSTHNPSLSLFFKVLQIDPPPEIFLLAIQPATITMGEPLSVPVAKTLDVLTKVLTKSV